MYVKNNDSLQQHLHLMMEIIRAAFLFIAVNMRSTDGEQQASINLTTPVSGYASIGKWILMATLVSR